MSRQLDLVVQGVVGTNPTLGYTPKSNRAFCRFRVAVTPRHREGDRWVDDDTMWMTAKAWGSLARHLAYSVHKGEPVVLVGRLSEEHWSGANGPGQSNVLTVQCGGHDLTRGEARFVRVTDASSPTSSPSPAASPNGAESSEGEVTSAVDQVTGAGTVVRGGVEPGGEVVPGNGTVMGDEASPGDGTAENDPWAADPSPNDPADAPFGPRGYVLTGEEIADPTEVFMA